MLLSQHMLTNRAIQLLKEFPSLTLETIFGLMVGSQGKPAGYCFVLTAGVMALENEAHVGAAEKCEIGLHLIVSRSSI